MSAYTITADQLASIAASRLQHLDRGDEAAADALDWVLTAEPGETLYLALADNGEGYASTDRADVEHAAGVRTTSFATVIADQFRECYEEGCTVFEIARPKKEA
jgi:hypothetical protein